MSHSLRPKLAALIGAATLSAATPAAAEALRDDRCQLARSPHERPCAEETRAPAHDVADGDLRDDRAEHRAAEHGAEHLAAEPWASFSDAAPAHGSLRTIIETRLESAERERRYGDIDELTTLWLTLARRDQLDRVVERGEQFLNVALKNQRRSELRSEARVLRRTACEEDPVDVAGDRCAPHELIDAERFVGRLSDPYQTAVKWSLTGMNHREVAERMGASHAAVRKWAQRLREQLGDDDLLS